MGRFKKEIKYCKENNIEYRIINNRFYIDLNTRYTDLVELINCKYED